MVQIMLDKPNTMKDNKPMKRNKVVMVRLSPEEYAALAQKAKEGDKSLGATLRFYFLAELKG